MMIKKKRIIRVSLLILLILLSPYIVSRFLAPGNRVSTHTTLSKHNEIETNRQVRIACYNIAHGRGLATSNWKGGSESERLKRLDDIVELIKSFNADILVLNEVDFDASWSYSINQAEYIAKKAGYPYWAEQRNLDFRVLTWTWRFGNAILSKFPIQNTELIRLPSYAKWESFLVGQKQGLLCQFGKADKTFFVIAAHISHRSEDLRVQSTKVFLEIAKEKNHPVIIAGDLNSTPPGFPNSNKDSKGENAIEVLDRSKLFMRRPVRLPVLDEELTYHAQDPKSVIDWVLIPKSWKFVEYRAVSSLLSDHRAVVALIERL